MDYYNTLREDIHESAVMGIQRGGREREMGCAGKSFYRSVPANNCRENDGIRELQLKNF